MILSSIPPATGPLLVTALLLAAAGVAKLSRPAPTGLALARLGLPGSDRIVRALGHVEITTALLAALFGGWLALPVLLLYLGFTAVTVTQVRAARAGGERADCGCFGDHSAPVDGTHVAVNVAAAAAATYALCTRAGGLVDNASAAPGATLVVLALAVTGAVAVRALITDLARVRALVRLGSDR